MYTERQHKKEKKNAHLHASVKKFSLTLSEGSAFRVISLKEKSDCQFAIEMLNVAVEI